jgi:hypothetical protein
MNDENHCEIDGVRYVAREGGWCSGCVGDADADICLDLPMCVCFLRSDGRSIVWAREEEE